MKILKNTESAQLWTDWNIDGGGAKVGLGIKMRRAGSSTKPVYCLPLPFLQLSLYGLAHSPLSRWKDRGRNFAWNSSLKRCTVLHTFSLAWHLHLQRTFPAIAKPFLLTHFPSHTFIAMAVVLDIREISIKKNRRNMSNLYIKSAFVNGQEAWIWIHVLKHRYIHHWVSISNFS